MKKLLTLCLVSALILSLTACKKQPASLNVFMLSGPTGMGAVNLMDAAEKGDAENEYSFKVVADPNEIVSSISTGDADIAAISTNLAAKLYNKTEGGVTVLAVNTLGVLDVLTLDTQISSLADLKGKKVYSTGKGANPEFIINYLLDKNGLTPEDVNVTYYADGTELLTVFAKESDAVVIAPHPVATSIIMKYTGAQAVLSLTKEWEAVSNDSSLMMGCVIVRNDFLKNNKSAVDKFLKEYSASVDAAVTDTAASAVLCEKYGIVPKAAVAEKALPHCNICFVTGDSMKSGLSGYLNVLMSFDKTSVGGKLPDDDFYYAYEK